MAGTPNPSSPESREMHFISLAWGTKKSSSFIVVFQSTGHLKVELRTCSIYNKNIRPNKSVWFLVKIILFKKKRERGEQGQES